MTNDQEQDWTLEHSCKLYTELINRDSLHKLLMLITLVVTAQVVIHYSYSAVLYSGYSTNLRQTLISDQMPSNISQTSGILVQLFLTRVRSRVARESANIGRTAATG